MDLDFLDFCSIFLLDFFHSQSFQKKKIPFSLTSSDFLVFIAYNLNPIDVV